MKKKVLETSVDSARQKITNLKLLYDEMDEVIQLELTDKKKMAESFDTQLERKMLVQDIADH